MSEVSEREKFEFEREKWRADIETRGREIAVKEREQASSKWRSPLVVAILAAAAAAAGNAIVAVVNGMQQVSLEDSKAESARILEMTKTGDTETAARNLDFLLHAGLIANPERVSKLSTFLANRAPGSGPSLPAPIAFEPSDSLSESTKQSLDRLMKDYISRLEKIGFPAGETVHVKIEFMPGGPNAYYQPNLMVIDTRLATDRTVPLREYNHHVLMAKRVGNETGQFQGLESGIADYLACSYLNDPKLGEGVAKALGLSKPFLRNMANDRNFGDSSSQEVHDVGEIWSGALWAMRAQLGRDVIDPILAKAWISTKWPEAEPEQPRAFVAALLAAAGSSERLTAIRNVLQVRHFPLPP